VSNSTPSTPPEGEQAREQAEAALRERGWNPITPYQLWESELAVGRSVDDAFEASLWNTPDAESDVPWLCDVGLTPPDSKKESLWLLGIPRPEEVPALLMEHVDILSVGPGPYTLDLSTGEVLDTEQARRRQGLATSAEREAEYERKTAPIRETLQAAWQKLAEGWETYEPSYSIGRTMDDTRRMVEIMAVPYCREDDGVLLLDLAACYDDTGRVSGGDVWSLSLDGVSNGYTLVSTGIPFEYYGKARVVLPLPGGAAEIPSPREALLLMKDA